MNHCELAIANEAQTRVLATQLAKQFVQVGLPLSLWLSGEIGTGKTTFVRGFLSAAGWHSKVKSPTYTLVEPYTIGDQTIFHFDLYRIKDYIELENIGIRDYFMQPAVYLIEWAERMKKMLPPSDLHLHFFYVTDDSANASEQRRLLITASSDKGELLLESCGCCSAAD